MNILFVRHGESVDDVEDRYGGWADYELTERGINQIIETAEKITDLGEKFEAVLSSPLKRAFGTAQIIADKLDVDMKVIELLKERNLNGILTGMTRTEARERYPNQVKKHECYEYVDGSERSQDFEVRVESAMRKIEIMNYGSVVVVTHGLFMKTLFKQLMNMDIVKVGDGGFALVGKTNGKYSIMAEDGIEYKQV